MLLACYFHDMANLQVKNVPESLHQRLRDQARERRCTLGDFVLRAIERELSLSEWQERLARRPETEPGIPAASLLAEEREERTGRLRWPDT